MLQTLQIQDLYYALIYWIHCESHSIIIFKQIFIIYCNNNCFVFRCLYQQIFHNARTTMDVTDTRLGPLLLLLIGLAIHSTDAYTSKTIFKSLRLQYSYTTTISIPEYGRTCKDIGCPPSEMCTMAVESCSYSQREGKDCGSYPTCSRNPNGRPQSPGKLWCMDGWINKHIAM